MDKEAKRDFIEKSVLDSKPSIIATVALDLVVDEVMWQASVCSAKIFSTFSGFSLTTYVKILAFNLKMCFLHKGPKINSHLST